MDPTESALVAEIRQLHHGRGLRKPRIELGPAVRNALRLSVDDEDSETIRRSLIIAWRHSSETMPRDLATLLLVASGITYGHPALTGRLEHWAEQEGVATRSAWRRHGDTIEQLARSLARGSGGDVHTVDDEGFYVIDFSQIADLTSSGAIFTARRTIRVTAPALDEVIDTVGFPGQVDEPDYRCLTGCSKVSVTHEYAGTWSYRLRLPRPLRSGEKWTYSVSVRLQDRSALIPMVGLVGVRVARSAHVELWLDPQDATAKVWPLMGVPALAANDDTPRPPFLEPMRPGCYVQDFTDLAAGKLYGLRWKSLPQNAG